MHVIKRSGVRESMRFDKITDRNVELCKDLDVNVEYLSQMVIRSLKDNMKTNEIDDLSSETAFCMATYSPDYDILAARIAINNLHKSTTRNFLDVTDKLYMNFVNGRRAALVNHEYYMFVKENISIIQSALDYTRDYLFSYFGFRTLCRSYLLKIKNEIIERPQHLFMRVALCIHGPRKQLENGKEIPGDISKVIQTYNEMSSGKFIHATPTLFNAGSYNASLSSCFLLYMNDSIDSIYDTLSKSAKISKYAGGIGIAMTEVRSKGSVIKSNNGKSDGIIPMIKVYNETARYVNQCFTPETKIYTLYGPKEIKDIKEGDMVITNTGEYKKVNKLFSRKINGGILEIKTKYGFEKLRCTGEHYILVLREGEVIPKYVQSKKLRPGDSLLYPDCKYWNDIPDISDDDCRMYGILMTSGKAMKDDYVLSLSNSESQRFVGRYLSDKKIPYSFEEETIKFPSKLLNFGDLSSFDKKYYHLPLYKTLSLIFGIVENNSNTDRSDVILFYSRYRGIIAFLRWQLLRVGVLTKCKIPGQKRGIVKSRGLSGNNFNFILKIPMIPSIAGLFGKEKREFSDFERRNVTNPTDSNRYYTSQITRISIKKYSGLVYDLNIQDNHNYLTDFGIAHNSGKRKGSIAMYIEPWHPEIVSFLHIRDNKPPEEQRARDIFTGLWIPDLFMKKVKEDGDWLLIDPSLFRDVFGKNLSDIYGEEFEKYYALAEERNIYTKKKKARKIWREIINSQEETGLPYMLYKDSVNEKSNQKNIGTIKSSNLCTEIVEYTDDNNIATCNLASIALPKFIKEGEFDFDELGRITEIIVENLNNVIDLNFYSVKEARNSNIETRPIGIGVQGLADVFFILGYSWGDAPSKELNQRIFETIYYFAVKKSHELSLIYGSYARFEGSPISQGILSYEMWGISPITNYNWSELKEKVKGGMRNSLLIAPMPTASTAQILGNTECIEPLTSNIYSRTVLSGDFPVINRYLYSDLKKLGLWTREIVDEIIKNNGSVQSIELIPKKIKNVYRTVWEIPQKTIVEMAAQRAPFIDQNQSLNVFFEHPTASTLTSLHFYAWEKGLKSSSYYVRSKPSTGAIKFTVNQEKEKTQEEKKLICSRENKEACLLCTS